MRSTFKIAMIVGAIVVALPYAAPADPAPVAVCGGPAPAQTSCTTGQHTYFVTPVAHGFSGTPATYIGRLRSTLSWTTGTATGSRTFYCDFKTLEDHVVPNQVRAHCLGSGSFPPDCIDSTPECTVRFTHTCKSTDAGKETGTGRGDWRCNVSHV